MVRAVRLLAVILVMAGGAGLRAADPIRTPFELVPLWSAEMMGHMTGRLQPACSGPDAGACERLAPGICEDTAYFTLPSPRHEIHSGRVIPHDPPRQTQSATPQAFRLTVANAGYGGFVYQINDPAFESIDLVLDCQFSGNNTCPTNRLHVRAVHEVAIRMPNGDRTVDLTRSASVRPDGTIAIRVDQALKASFLADARAVYAVRAVAECFATRPRPIEWSFAVREAHSPDARALGAIVARLTPDLGIAFVYRSPSGQDVPLDTDWIQEDWGYTYMRDQTLLDRKGDWFLLPRRPFPSPVWVHLPGRTELSRVSTGTIYTLSKPVRAKIAGTSRTVTFPAGNLVVLAVHGRRLEIRREDKSDSPCAGSDERARTPRGRTFLVDAEELYDADGHLQLRPAYPRGC